MIQARRRAIALALADVLVMQLFYAGARGFDARAPAAFLQGIIPHRLFRGMIEGAPLKLQVA